MTRPLCIGLLGATDIATKAIVTPAQHSHNFVVKGVAASDPVRAKVFAKQHGLAYAYDSYDALLCDPSIDIVYLSLHNSAHMQNALNAMRAGKHVIVEKPLCLGRREWHALKHVASTEGVRVVEAVMCSGHPWQHTVATMLRQHLLGELISVKTVLSFTLPARGYRRYPESGGGIFWDAASYWIQMLQATIDLESLSVDGLSAFDGPHGIDTDFQAYVTCANDVSAEMHCSFKETVQATHEWQCRDGKLVLKNFLLPARASFPINLHVSYGDGRREVISHPATDYYSHQLQYLAELFCAGNDHRWSELYREQGERIGIMDDIYSAALSLTERSNQGLREKGDMQ